MIIDGAWLAETVREMVQQGRWDQGRRMLSQSTLTTQQIEDVLRGALDIAGPPYELRPAPPELEEQVKAGARYTLRDWLDDRAAESGVSEDKLPLRRAPNGKGWRCVASGTMETLGIETMSERYRRGGDLAQICGARKCSQLSGLALLHASRPEQARCSLIYDQTGELLWATFELEPLPVSPPWWPSLIAQDEGGWWDERCGWAPGTVRGRHLDLERRKWEQKEAWWASLVAQNSESSDTGEHTRERPSLAPLAAGSAAESAQQSGSQQSGSQQSGSQQSGSQQSGTEELNWKNTWERNA